MPSRDLEIQDTYSISTMKIPVENLKPFIFEI